MFLQIDERGSSRCFAISYVFEKFFDACLKFYGLDPCHFFSSSGLSWDSMLKMAGVKLEKISNIVMYLFIEKGLRGGISYIAKKCAKANKRLKNYYPTKPVKICNLP